MLKWFGNGASSQPRSAHVGRVFTVNEYQVVVEDVIAEGGFAVVFQVRSSPGQRYALKRLAVNNEHDLFLCRQEIAITKALSDCRHSVTYISSCVNKLGGDVHEVLILLQLYTGGRVVDMMNQRLSRRQTFSEGEVLKIFSNICQAVARLHHRTKPIIHRDLKVENILRDSEGQFILCDFGSCTVKPMHPEVLGVAECEDQIARFTTLAYRAPEMVSLYSGKTVSTKADIWALGCLLYKLCFFTTPFGEQPLAIVSGTFTIPDDSPFTENLHSLIRYMLEPDLEKRPSIWQVCEITFRLRRTKNPVPNVFHSPRPPSHLPIAPRARDAKATPPKPTHPPSPQPQVTPARARMEPLPTTTISSRERPRARRSRPVGRSASPPPRPSHPQFLSVATSPSDHSRSLDSGLDAFGAVPFTPTPAPLSSSSHTRPHHPIPTPLSSSSSSHTHPQQPKVDAFGAQPFTVGTPPSSPEPRLDPPGLSQGTLLSREARKDLFGATPFSQQDVDSFGSAPFVVVSQNT